MKINENKIQQLLLEKNKNNHEASQCVECKFGTNVKGGKWIEHKDIPNLDEFAHPVYMDEKGALLYPVSHNLIIGSTGSGKTTVLYDNCIDFYSKLNKKVRPSFLVLDLKGDMYVRHAKKLEEEGYKVKVMDMRNPYYSACYNPLATIYEFYKESYEIEQAILNGKIGKTFKGITYDTVSQACRIALGRSFELKDAVDRYINEIAELLIVNTDAKNLSWTEGGRNCLKAIIYTMLHDSENPDYGLTKEKFTISNVARTAFNTGDDYEDIIKWLERAKHMQVVSGALSSVYKLKASITRDGYTSSMTAELNKYTSRSIEALTSNNDISIADIAKGEEDYAVFLITDSRVQATNVVAMMFINDLINTLVDTADKKPSRCLDKDFVILADEMGNLPQVPNMCNKITTLRSRKVWLHMSVQSVEQLRYIYKEEVMKTIVDNCDTHFFLGSNSQDSKKYFAESLGKQIGIVTSANIQGTGEATASMSTGDVPVVRMSDMEDLNLGEYYVRSRVCPTLKSSMIPYFKRTDVKRNDKEFKPEYNGYEPDANAYYIQNVLIEDGLYDDYFGSEKRKKIVPKKSSIIAKIHKIEKEEKNEVDNAETEDDSACLTKIETSLPQKTFYNRLASDPKTMAKKLYYDVKDHVKKTGDFRDKIIIVVALGILPEKVQREVASIDPNSYVPTTGLTGWIDFFKYEILFDRNLKHSEGKETVLKEINRRIYDIENLDCFSNTIKSAYEEVYDCVKEMTDAQFEKYCKRVEKKNK